MADIQIAPTTQGQLQAVLEQTRVTFEEHRARHPRQFPDTTLFKLEERHKDAVDLQGDRPMSFIAQLDGKPAGFVLLRSIMKVGMIYDIGVFPDRRRQGIGQALVQHAVATAVGYDWDTLFASVWDWNTASHRMFQSAGFNVPKPFFGKLADFFPKGRVAVYQCAPKDMPKTDIGDV